MRTRRRFRAENSIDTGVNKQPDSLRRLSKIQQSSKGDIVNTYGSCVN
uniref:NCBP2 n=1 Tax=Heterorhabditis bacteriophora TaxID=37862 RepID=A0A1I7XAJ5_HETBA